MKVMLIVWVMYESTFLKMASSAVDVTIFNSMSECVEAQRIVKATLSKPRYNDRLVVSCKQLSRSKTTKEKVG